MEKPLKIQQKVQKIQKLPLTKQSFNDKLKTYIKNMKKVPSSGPKLGKIRQNGQASLSAAQKPVNMLPTTKIATKRRKSKTYILIILNSLARNARTQIV